MRTRLPLTALGLAVVTTLVVTAPAAAAPFTGGDIVVGDTTWDVYRFTANDLPTVRSVTDDSWQGSNTTFDSGLRPVFKPTSAVDLTDYSYLYCAADGDRSTATDGTGDEIVTCPLQAFESGNGTLDAMWELRIFNDNTTVRSRLIVTNNTPSTIEDATVGIRDNYWQDDDTRVGASSTAGAGAPESTTTVDGDLIWVTYDIVTDSTTECPVVLTAAGNADATVRAFMSESAGNGNDDQNTFYPLIDLAPGQTVEIVQFTVVNLFSYDEPAPAAVSLEREATEVTTDEGVTKTPFLEPAALFLPSALAAVAESWAERSRFDTLSDRDAAGIADLTAVLNWAVAEEEEEVEEEQLAATGPTEAMPLIALSGLLLLAGVTAVAVRRRA